jgi:hypothetical protein
MKPIPFMLTMTLIAVLSACSSKPSQLLTQEKQPRRVAPLSESTTDVQPCDTQTLDENCTQPEITQ